MTDTSIPTIVIDDTPVKRRGICDFVEETLHLRLRAQLGDAVGTIQLVEKISRSDVQVDIVLKEIFVAEFLTSLQSPKG